VRAFPPARFGPQISEYAPMDSSGLKSQLAKTPYKEEAIYEHSERDSRCGISKVARCKPRELHTLAKRKRRLRVIVPRLVFLTYEALTGKVDANAR